jgi:hypothetical protein
MWPKLEDDYMEIGESGWIPVGQGCFLNKNNGHTIDEIGREFDENGVVIYDPEKKVDNI